MKKRLVAAVLVMVSATASPRATHPPVTWTPGDFYFDIDGTPALPISTNPFGTTPTHFTTLFQQLALNGGRIVRIHVPTYFKYRTNTGDTEDEVWIAEWETVFREAETNGLYVLPVLDVWANWNTTMGGWSSNIFNAGSTSYNCVNLSDCGPATTPADLLVDGSPTQNAWLDHIEYLVTQWKDNDNIIGWEVFSELDLIEGHDRIAGCPVVDGVLITTPCPVVKLFEAAATRIRTQALDSRPITASTAGVNDMPALWTSSHLDWGQLHPYAGFAPNDGNLDRLILDKVRLRRTQYGKPVLLGEGGMDTLFHDDKTRTLHLKPRASVGINQAIWAGAVSGAMNARALWFEDGYDDGYDICTHAELGPVYAADPACVSLIDADILTLAEVNYAAAAPVANFVDGVDYTGFEPIALTDTGGDDMIDGAGDLLGAALGDSAMVLGWVRDVQSDAPLCTDPASATCTYDLADHWPWRDLVAQQVKVDMPAGALSADWSVEFYDTTTGNAIGIIDADQDVNGDITFTLRDFQGSIAFKIFPADPIVVELNITPRFRRHNNMNLNFREGFVVIVLNTFVAGDPPQGFDATTVNPSSIRVGPLGAAPVRSELHDFQQDGDLDLAMLFEMGDPGFPCRVSELVLTGETTSGRTITGSGPIRVIGCGGP